MDVLGCLPGPPTKHNLGAADALAGKVFAYGVAAAIAVLDVRSAPVPEALTLRYGSVPCLASAQAPLCPIPSMVWLACH